MIALALFPLVMIGVLLLVFTMIMDDSHTAHDSYTPVDGGSFEEESIAA